jgi:hypothetical protein
MRARRLLPPLLLAAAVLLPLTVRAQPTLVREGNTLRETATGLVWKACAEGQSAAGGRCTGAATRMPWAEAKRYVRADGWRLPHPSELRVLHRALADAGDLDAALPPALPGGGDARGHEHWADGVTDAEHAQSVRDARRAGAEPMARDAYPMVVDLRTGDVGMLNDAWRTARPYVRLVRGTARLSTRQMHQLANGQPVTDDPPADATAAADEAPDAPPSAEDVRREQEAAAASMRDMAAAMGSVPAEAMAAAGVVPVRGGKATVRYPNADGRAVRLAVYLATDATRQSPLVTRDVQGAVDVTLDLSAHTGAGLPFVAVFTDADGQPVKQIPLLPQ